MTSVIHGQLQFENIKWEIPEIARWLSTYLVSPRPWAQALSPYQK
jgi:hypothetical protein